MTLLQLGGDVLLWITRMVKQESFSRFLSNCQIVQINLPKVGLKAIAVKNFSTPGENTYAVGYGLQGNYFEPIGPADRPAYLDNSPAGIRTAQIIAADTPCATGNASQVGLIRGSKPIRRPRGSVNTTPTLGDHRFPNGTQCRVRPGKDNHQYRRDRVRQECRECAYQPSLRRARN